MTVILVQVKWWILPKNTLEMFYKCVALLNIGHFSDGFSGDK